MKSLKDIVRETHVGYGGSIAGYSIIAEEGTLTDEDLAYAEKVINKACEGQVGYDCFSDEGGINIAAYLLAEVKAFRKEWK